ncbi:MAG TPA: 2Fe-2S iron-sulfur cluster binding domain-containing protein [Kaistiaceae bacterium]|nr:2Fe-2S iron-sulfur cluster binding domain-containing protein [Kaistiaceae bacterium]
MKDEPMSRAENIRFEVKILDTGEKFSCSASDHLLRAMLALGRKGIPSGCHGGGCGVCKVKVTRGTFTSLVMSRAHVSEEEERDGIVLACRVMPTSDLEVEVVGKLKKAITRPKAFGLV